MKLDLSGLNKIGYYREMNTTIEEIFLYDLKKPHVIPLHLVNKEGLYDRMGKFVNTGMMQSFEVPKGNENIGDSYKYIQKYLNPNKIHGLINASESAANPENNIVAVFEIEYSKQ